MLEQPIVTDNISLLREVQWESINQFNINYTKSSWILNSQSLNNYYIIGNFNGKSSKKRNGERKKENLMCCLI